MRAPRRIAVLRDQLADVDVQLAAGTIPPADAEGLRVEIKRRMLAAGHIPEEARHALASRACRASPSAWRRWSRLPAVRSTASDGQAGPRRQHRCRLPAGAAPTAGRATDAPGRRRSRRAGRRRLKQEGRRQRPMIPKAGGCSAGPISRCNALPMSATAYGKAVALQARWRWLSIGLWRGAGAGRQWQGDARRCAKPLTKAVAQDGADARARYFLGVKKGSRMAMPRARSMTGSRCSANSATDAPWVPQLRGVIEQTALEAKIDVSARLAALRQPASGGASVAGAADAGARRCRRGCARRRHARTVRRTGGGRRGDDRRRPAGDDPRHGRWPGAKADRPIRATKPAGCG